MQETAARVFSGRNSRLRLWQIGPYEGYFLLKILLLVTRHGPSIS